MSRTIKHELTGPKSVFRSCENHGTCPWCKHNRTYSSLRNMARCKDMLREYYKDPDYV